MVLPTTPPLFLILQHPDFFHGIKHPAKLSYFLPSPFVGKSLMIACPAISEMPKWYMPSMPPPERYKQPAALQHDLVAGCSQVPRDVNGAGKCWEYIPSKIVTVNIG